MLEDRILAYPPGVVQKFDGQKLPM
jgi:hypothetical protein